MLVPTLRCFPLPCLSGVFLDSTARVALITGSSSGLGRWIAREFLACGYNVFLVGRESSRLKAIAAELLDDVVGYPQVGFAPGDVTCRESVAQVFHACQARFGGLDVLVNCVGESDRGVMGDLTTDRIDELMRVNVHSALLCSQAALPMLRQSEGAIVNIGSLASKVGARYLGGYAIAKHALAGMTQQMRLELLDDGIHVGLVCPGPIRREDAGTRYKDRVGSGLPNQAAAPGGGARLKGLDPAIVAKAVVRCAQRRLPEIILPAYVRLLVTIGNALPRFGDRLLLRFTRPKE